MTTAIVLQDRPLKPISTTGYGSGKLSGTVLGPDGSPISRQVWLFLEGTTRDGGIKMPGLTAIQRKRSGVDGTFFFPYLNQSLKFTVIAYDETGEHDPVIKGGLIPEPME